MGTEWMERNTADIAPCLWPAEASIIVSTRTVCRFNNAVAQYSDEEFEKNFSQVRGLIAKMRHQMAIG